MTNSERALLETNQSPTATYTTVSTLATFPFSPDIKLHLPVDLTRTCLDLITSNVFPVRWAEYVFLEDNKIMIDFRYGMRNGSIYLCYPWYDRHDDIRDTSWTDFGEVSYDEANAEYLLRGYFSGRTDKAYYTNKWIAPQNMMDEWNNYFWPGDSYVSIDIFMNKAEWKDGDGFTYIVAQNGKSTGIINFTTNFVRLGGKLYFLFESTYTNTSTQPITQAEFTSNYPGDQTFELLDAYSGEVWITIKVLIQNNAGVLNTTIKIINAGTDLHTYAIPPNPAFTINANPAATIIYGSRFMRFVYIKKDNANETVGQVSEILRVKNLKKVEASDPNSATLTNSTCRTAKYYRTYFLYTPKDTSVCAVGYQDHYLTQNAKYGDYLPRYKDLGIDYSDAVRKKTNGL